MITKDYIQQLAETHLKDSPVFVTGIKIGSDNHVNVFIDGDKGVTIADCVGLSRFIEAELNQRNEDFALDVSSHGATTPLVMPRQYPQHIGREFEIRLLDGKKAEGKLVSMDRERLVLEYSVRENKPIGKGKITVTKQEVVPFNQIKESKIKLKY